MVIDSQAPIEFWGEAVNSTVSLHQRSPNEGLRKRDDRNGYQVPYETPYKMLHAFLSQQPFSVADSRQLHPPSANDKIIKGAQSTPCLRLIQLLAVPFFNIHIFTRFQMTSSM
jgi:hypothetical protein